MPFNLRLSYVPHGGGVGWEMEGPNWLTLETLPFDASCIREIMDDSWCRDRYAPISAEELNRWHQRSWNTRSLEDADDFTRQSYERFMAHVGCARASQMYLLNWYEWESGMN